MHGLSLPRIENVIAGQGDPLLCADPAVRSGLGRRTDIDSSELILAPLTPGVKVTYSGLMKTVTISSFKAHISEHLRKVRKGARIVICDRETPIAEVVPYRADDSSDLSVRGPLSAPFRLPRTTVRIDHDPLEFLIEDRGSR